jgi:hypothetical protein
VPIHEIGEQNGVPYFVMPLIDGVSLDRLLADPSGVIPSQPSDRARWVASLGRQAARALAYSHGQDVLHRDIKPSNLLLDVDGTLWLVDFGLAKLADELSLTSTGDLPGTLRYLAPECLHSAADGRSDVYSLGLTLYELLVGRPAFPALERARLLQQIQTHPVVAPSRLVPTVPRDLETVILRAIAFDPSARYRSAADFADDLERFLGGRPIQARRASAGERLVRWCLRNPVVAGLTVMSLVLGLIAAVFVGLFLNAPPHHRGRTPAWREAPPPESAAPAEPSRYRIQKASATVQIAASKPSRPSDNGDWFPRWKPGGLGPLERGRFATPKPRRPRPENIREGPHRAPRRI